MTRLLAMLAGEYFKMNILMYVAFLGMQTDLGLECDHINQNTLDNRTENLRPVRGTAHTQNMKRTDYRQLLADHYLHQHA